MCAALTQERAAHDDTARGFNSYQHTTEQRIGQLSTRLLAAEATLTAARALIPKWLELADKDHHTATDDMSGGVWAYQHEASGRSRAWKHAVVGLEAALTASPAAQKE